MFVPVAAHDRAGSHADLAYLALVKAFAGVLVKQPEFHSGQGFAAAKAGIVGLTRSLSIEFGRLGATVNAVAPGFVLTDMTRATAERLGVEIGQFVAEATRDVPMGRGGTPEDIAQAVAFFADPRSGYVSGQVLYVAGGPRG